MVVLKYISKIINKASILSLLLLSISLVSCMSCSVNGNSSPKEPLPIIDPPIATNTFKNPILNSGADPWVIKDGNEYFVTFTTGNNITLMRTKKMSDLKNGSKKVIWIPPSTGLNSRDLWAPELHRINGKWYIYYAASDGINTNHKMWVLENTAADPFTGVWQDKGELLLPDNKWAIDGSPFELNGKYYFIWSGWEGNIDVRQDIYIAEMNSPFSVVGNRVALLKPTTAWEINNTTPQVAEGPQFLLKNDKVFVFYSAGACWKDGYSVGAIWMEINSNPMNLNSWKRLDTNPLFVSNVAGNAFGPGHNSFFKSLDGNEDWILYHANPQPGKGCGDNRSMRMQKISWDNTGLPVLGTPESLDKNLVKPNGE